MSKSLKAGLLLASTLLLVACGSDEPVEDVNTGTESATTETTEVETPATGDEVAVDDVEADVKELPGMHLVFGGDPDEEGTYTIHEARIDDEGKVILSVFDYVTKDGMSLRHEDDEFTSAMTKYDEVLLGMSDVTQESLTKALDGAGVDLEAKHTKDFIHAAVQQYQAYLVESGAVNVEDVAPAEDASVTEEAPSEE